MSACSDQGSFANPHLGEFLTPRISPLDMIFVGWQRFSSCYVVISRLEKRRPGFEPCICRLTGHARTQYTKGSPLEFVLYTRFQFSLRYIRTSYVYRIA